MRSALRLPVGAYGLVTVAVVVAVCACGAAPAALGSTLCPGLPSPSGPPQRAVSLSAAVLTQFGVLRRPPTAQDAVPARALGALPLGSYDPAYVRRLGGSGSGGVFLVVGHLLDPLPFISCESGGLPAQLRKLVPRERALAKLATYCLVTSSPRADTYSCSPLQTVSSGYSLGQVARLSDAGTDGVSPGPNQTGGLVPDGVASVTLTYRATRVTALVTSNYFAIAPPAAPQALTHAFTKLQEQIRASKPTAAQERRLAQLERDLSTFSVPAIVQWQNAAGAVLRQFRRPRTLPYDESGTAMPGQTSFGPGL